MKNKMKAAYMLIAIIIPSALYAAAAQNQLTDIETAYASCRNIYWPWSSCTRIAVPLLIASAAYTYFTRPPKHQAYYVSSGLCMLGTLGIIATAINQLANHSRKFSWSAASYTALRHFYGSSQLDEVFYAYKNQYSTAGHAPIAPPLAPAHSLTESSSPSVQLPLPQLLAPLPNSPPPIPQPIKCLGCEGLRSGASPSLLTHSCNESSTNWSYSGTPTPWDYR